ncbi:unnamed protein product, partial [Brassica rapa subsp. trilocularis]
LDSVLGISRDSIHKRRATGGKQKQWRKKRKYEMGRQPANTKLSSNKTVRRIRVRGGNVKWRALRLDTGNYSWGSEAVTRKTRVLDVVYNASNNELVRTKTLVKSAIVQVDAAPFKQWYLQHYGVEVGRKKKNASTAAAAKKDGEEGEEAAPAAAAPEETKKSNHVLRKIESRQEGRSLDSHIEDQFASGRLLACISSRPGQCGRADGYILEGKELEFYQKKIQKKKGKDTYVNKVFVCSVGHGLGHLAKMAVFVSESDDTDYEGLLGGIQRGCLPAQAMPCMLTGAHVFSLESN